MVTGPESEVGRELGDGQSILFASSARCVKLPLMKSNIALLPALLERWNLQNKIVSNIVMISFGVALLAIAAQLRIELPGKIVPFTAQTLAVLLIGASFGSWRGAATTLFYLGSGAAGLPFFAGGTAGLGYVTGATAGYLFGFVFAAYLMGLLNEMGLGRSLRTAWSLFLLGHLVIFFFGVIWLAEFVGLKRAFLAGFVPFIPGEIIKTTLAAWALPWMRKIATPS